MLSGTSLALFNSSPLATPASQVPPREHYREGSEFLHLKDIQGHLGEEALVRSSQFPPLPYFDGT